MSGTFDVTWLHIISAPYNEIRYDWKPSLAENCGKKPISSVRLTLISEVRSLTLSQWNINVEECRQSRAAG
jgi:hypothetical protein